MLLIFTPIYSLLIFVNIIGYAYLLKKIIKINTSDIFENFIIGALLLIFFSYFINFFLPLTSIITNIFFLIFTLIGFFSLWNNEINISYKKIFTLIFFLTLITFFSKNYNDYELYHLPYIEVLRKFKIIFGLSNLDFRYGHSSVLQNITAFQYNTLMGNDSYIFFPVLLFLISLNKIYEKIFKTDSTTIFFVCLVSFMFFAIHGSRFGALGNDYPSHILAIITIIYFLELKGHKQLEVSKSFIFFSLCFLIIVSKFSLVLYSILAVYILFNKNLKIIKLLSPLRIFFLLTLTLFFFTKNFINSSCLIYPIPKLCFETSWSVDKYSYSSPETISVISSIHVKNYWHSDHLLKHDVRRDFELNLLSDNKIYDEYLNLNEHAKKEFLNYHFYKDYLRFKNWSQFYFKDADFYKLLKDVILLNFLLLVIALLVFGKKKKNQLFKFKDTISFVKESSFFISFSIICFVIWFLNFPQLRYGFSYCLIFFLLPILFIFNKLEINFIRENFNKTIKVFFSIILIYVFYANSIRIYENLNDIDLKSGNSNIVPLYRNHGYKTLDIDGFELRQPIYLCSNIEQLCTVFTQRFLDADREIVETNYNYLLIK